MTTESMGEGLPALLRGLVRDGRIWELGHELARGMPTHPNHPPFFFTMVKRHGDAYREGGYSAANDLIILGGHHGTHMDALGHVSVDGRLHSGADAAEAQRGLVGLRSDHIGEHPPLVTRGLLVDVPGLHGLSELPPGYLITVAEAEAALAAQDLTIRPGDAVLFRTGWANRWDTPDRFFPPGGVEPGPGAEVADWLIAHGVAVTGADTMAYESVTTGQNSMPCHSKLLTGAGIPIIEMLVFEELAAAGVHELLFIALPLRIRGATGSPIRPIALT